MRRWMPFRRFSLARATISGEFMFARKSSALSSIPTARRCSNRSEMTSGIMKRARSTVRATTTSRPMPTPAHTSSPSSSTFSMMPEICSPMTRKTPFSSSNWMVRQFIRSLVRS